MLKRITLATALLLSIHANASVDTVKANLSKLYPATTVTSVTASPISGIYELVLGKNIAYTDESAQFFVFGDIIRMKDQVNLTDPRRDELKKIDFKELPFEQAIKFKNGKGERKLAVFSDPDCPFCKRLELELRKLDNVTVYVFPMPLASLHPNARTISKKIWCSADRAAAWRSYLLDGVQPSSDGLCENPIDKVVALGKSLNFDGTPMSVLEDGTVVPGALSASELDYKLDKVAAKLKK